MNKTTWTHPDGGEISYKTFDMHLVTLHDGEQVIDGRTKCFGRWNQSTSEHTVNGVIYPILGEGDFDGTVKFLDSNAVVNEASVKFFDLATKKQYNGQFLKLEEKPPPPQQQATSQPIVKKNLIKKKAKKK